MKLSIKQLRSLIQETLYSAWSPKHGNDKSVEVEADNTKIAGDKASDELFHKYGIKADPMTIDMELAQGSAIKYPWVMIDLKETKETIYSVETVDGELMYEILEHNSLEWRSTDYAQFFKEHSVEKVSWASYMNPITGRQGYGIQGDLLNGTYPADEWLNWLRRIE